MFHWTLMRLNECGLPNHLKSGYHSQRHLHEVANPEVNLKPKAFVLEHVVIAFMVLPAGLAAAAMVFFCGNGMQKINKNPA